MAFWNKSGGRPAGKAARGGPDLPAGAVGDGDVIALLPPKAAAKLVRLREVANDAAVVSRSISAQREEKQLEIMRLETRLKHLQGGTHGFGRADSSHPEWASLPKDLARLKAEDDRALQRYTEIGNTSGALRQALSVAERWLFSLPAGTRIVDAAAVVIARNFAGTDGIEKVRDRLAALRADRAALEAAPQTSAEARAQARKEIAALAERGRPRVAGLIEAAEPIGWPKGHIRLEAATIADSGFAGGQVSDAIALTAWLFRDQLSEAVDELINESAVDDVAISGSDKPKKLAQIDGAILDLERQHVALIDAAGDNAYPADLDPRALLGIDIK